MSVFEDFFFPSCDGKTQIHVRKCVPETAPVATVQIAHGIAEHVERYDDFMQYLAAHGILAVANDHLGHGQSINGPEDLGYFADEDGWWKVSDDMHTLHGMIKTEYPGVPCFLFGHSMGSFLARTYLIRFPGEFDGAVISGTGQQNAITVKAGLLMGKGEIKKHGGRYKSDKLDKLAFGSYNKCFEPRRTNYDWLSRDNTIVDAYIADPLSGFLPGAGLFTDMMTGIGFICKQSNADKMDPKTPIFFISGAMDPVGANGKGVKQAYQSFQKAGVKDVSMKLYENGRHEMLNELNRDEVFADVLGWIESKIK